MTTERDFEGKWTILRYFILNAREQVENVWSRFGEIDDEMVEANQWNPYTYYAVEFAERFESAVEELVELEKLAGMVRDSFKKKDGSNG